MTQNTWGAPDSAMLASEALMTRLPGMADNLRDFHRGLTEPASMTAGMFWEDTTTGLLKIRNAANSAWIVRGSLTKDQGLYGGSAQFLALSATTKLPLFVAPLSCKVNRLVIVSDTATSGSSGGTEWQFELKRETGGGAQLFSAAVGTSSSVGGVGGGAELAAYAAFVLTPDQNATLAANDVLSIRAVKVGSPTSPLAALMAWLDVTTSND